METGAFIDAVVSHAQSLGVFDQINAFEPKSAPGNGLTCAVWQQSLGPARGRSSLTHTSVRMVMQVRIFTSMLTEPQDYIEPTMVSACDKLMNAYSGDFQLDGLISHIDLLGAYGTPMESLAGYVKVDTKMMRVITITLPLIINDAWEQVA